MAFNAFYQQILNRSTTSYARVAACGLIGTIMGFVAYRRADRRGYDFDEVWPFMIGGGLIGFAAGMALTLLDLARSPTVSPATRRWALVGLVIFSLVFFIGLCVTILVLTGK